MPQMGGQIYIAASEADHGVVHHIAAYFCAQLSSFQACQLSHLHSRQSAADQLPPVLFAESHILATSMQAIS